MIEKALHHNWVANWIFHSP